MKIFLFFGITILGLSLFSCTSSQSGCSSLKECLSEYDFEGARKLVEDYGSDGFKELTIAESKYWADKGEIDKALAVVDESWGIDDSYWPEEDWQSWRFNIIEIGVTKLCERNNFRDAKLLALKASDELNIDGFKIGSGTGKYLDEDGIEKDYSCMGCGWKEIKATGEPMRASLIRKIDEYEKIVQQ